MTTTPTTTLVENATAALQAAKSKRSTSVKAGWSDYREVVAALADGQALDDRQAELLADCLESMALTDSILAADVREWQRRPLLENSVSASEERCEAARIAAEKASARFEANRDLLLEASEIHSAYQTTKEALVAAEKAVVAKRLNVKTHERQNPRLFKVLSEIED